jgi:hypothetical protein
MTSVRGVGKKLSMLFCWRQGSVILFPLKLEKGDKTESKETSKWDPLSCLPPAYNPEASAFQAESQDQDGDSSQEFPEAQPELHSEPPSNYSSASVSTSGHALSFSGFRREF